MQIQLVGGVAAATAVPVSKRIGATRGGGAGTRSQ